MLLMSRGNDPTSQPLGGCGDLHLASFGRRLVSSTWSTDSAPPYRSASHNLILTHTGAAKIEMEGTWYHLTPGRVAIVPGFNLLRRQTAGFDHTWVCFTSGSLSHDLQVARLGRIIDAPMNPLWERSFQALARLDAQPETTTLGDVTAIEAGLLLAMTMLLDQQVRTEEPRGIKSDDLVRRAITWIDAHYHERPTLAGIAAAVKCSGGHLHARFTQEIGVSPTAYAQRQRLRDAQHLLSTTDLTVREVALKCGYDDQFHFSRVARRFFGLSPQEIRKMARPS